MPAKDSFSVSLPAPLKNWVASIVDGQGYPDVSAYFHELVRLDQIRRAKLKLESRLFEAMDSGKCTEWTREDWTRLRRGVIEKHGATRRRKRAP